MLRKFIYNLIASLLVSVSNAAWVLDNSASYFNFVSTKSIAEVDIAEIGQFQQLTGEISDDGNVSININLASVDTLVDLRDERLREILFNIVEFPQAHFGTTIDKKLLMSLDIGESINVELSGKLSLHGDMTNINADLQVFKLTATKLIVVTNKPIIILSDAYGLLDGINELKDIMSLANIVKQVPVTFVLHFTKEA